MPVAPHFRITWLFDIANSEEVAVTGVSAAEANWTDVSCKAAFDGLQPGNIDALDNAMLVFLTAVGQGFAFARWGRYTGVKVAAIGANGEYITDPYTKIRATPHVGTQNGPLPQTSICVSFRAESAIGPATRGRMFIPYTSAISWTDGTAPRIDQAYCQSIATYGAAFIGSVNNALENVIVGQSPACRIFQVTPAGSAAVPAANLIHEVRCGDVVDTQRKRRNRLQETYKSATVAAATRSDESAT